MSRWWSTDIFSCVNFEIKTCWEVISWATSVLGEDGLKNAAVVASWLGFRFRFRFRFRQVLATEYSEFVSSCISRVRQNHGYSIQATKLDKYELPWWGKNVCEGLGGEERGNEAVERGSGGTVDSRSSSPLAIISNAENVGVCILIRHQFILYRKKQKKDKTRMIYLWGVCIRCVIRCVIWVAAVLWKTE